MKFEQIKGKLGFGCMRLPMNGTEVDLVEFEKMVDEFINAGFNYFDTAHVYIDGKSELALKEALVKRYPREAYLIADKLSGPNFNSADDLEELFKTKLNCLGVDYIDFYLLHAQGSYNYDKFKECECYEFAFEKKKQGLVKHVGISFHDNAAFLEKIIKENPEIEFVQLQFNYLDYEDEKVQARLCYEVCEKYNKPVIVMEPVRGGRLVNMPIVAKKLLTDLNNGSVASYAIRYASSFDNIFMVLSGMSNMEQMQDNIKTMVDFKPIDAEEMKVLDKVVAILRKSEIIKCTSCNYCVPGCPMNIDIPKVFASHNENIINDTEINKLNAADCIECGACEEICPQKLNIRELLKKICE